MIYQSENHPGINPDEDRHLPNDVGNAAQLIHLHGDDLRWVQPWKTWMFWDGTRWCRSEQEEVLGRCLDTAKRIANDLLPAASPSDVQDAARNRSRKAQRRERLTAMAELAKANLAKPPTIFDSNPFLLNVRNGTIDLRTGELREHDRADSITKLAPFEFHSDAEAPTWNQFLNRIMGEDEEMVGYLRRWCGYAATGDTSEQRLVIAHGSGANGKSTFLEAVATVLGDYATKTRADTLVERRPDRIPADLARLKGARLVHATETDAGGRFSEAVVKELTGQDTITARFLYGQWFQYRPEFKIVLAVNHLPRVVHGGHAMWRRLAVVPFAQTIPPEERDPKLPEKLLLETEGILAWIVRGAQEWQELGLDERDDPEPVRVALKGYREESMNQGHHAHPDPVAVWIRECCDQDTTVATPTAELAVSYRQWRFSSGSPELAPSELGKRLKVLGFEGNRRTIDGRRQRVTLGLRVKRNAKRRG